MSRFDLSDHDRRLAGLVRVGRVAETTGDKVRVDIGEIRTHWIPVLAPAAGAMRAWSPPSVGEQVLVLAPGGEPDQAVALAGIYSAASPAPSQDLEETRIEWEDGAAVSYHRGAKRMTIDLPGGKLNILAPGGVTIIGDVTVDGDVIARGISLIEHIHGGIVRGSAKTDPPNDGGLL
jgi:phage baseplate assembly protein gpV